MFMNGVTGKTVMREDHSVSWLSVRRTHRALKEDPCLGARSWFVEG